jgi:predicted metal-dependent phosphotriesterase family hydrolase
MENQTTVEGTTQEAPESEIAVTQTTAQVDYEALLAQKDDELSKVNEKMENYRKGMLLAKGKIPGERQTDSDGTESQEEMTRRIVQETLLTSEQSRIQAEKDQVLKSALKRNKELETALKNRGQISSASGDGSNQDRPEGKKDNYFSNDQISALKAKGFDDAKIEALKKNMAKVMEMPK